MRATLPETYKFFQTFAGRSEGRPAAAGRADLAGAPGRSVADKKAALVEAARANSPELTKERSKSSNARSLQRATVELIRSAPDSKAFETANTRMAELVQDPDTEPDEEELPSS